MIFNYKKAFTLTEVLIATAIVGVIAALVMPMVITTYQNNLYEHMYTKQYDAIKGALEALPVTENKTRFADTIMSSDDINDNTSGLFLKKYFKVARYCGNITDSGADCFAPDYVTYDEHTHSRVHNKVTDLIARGTCAMLKNGTSLCITPQPVTPTGTWKSVQVVMDLNGIKGPNVVGRDFRVLAALPPISSGTTLAGKQQGEGVYAENEVPIAPKQVESCTSYTNDSSDGCCLYKKKHNMIHTGDICCTANSKIGPTVAACSSVVTLHLDYYPTSSNYSYGINPWSSYSNNNFRIDPSSAVLPSSLGVIIKCGDGSFGGGTLAAADIMTALVNKKDVKWPNGIYNKTCTHLSESLLWSQNKDTSITIDGITYKIQKH